MVNCSKGVKLDLARLFSSRCWHCIGVHLASHHNKQGSPTRLYLTPLHPKRRAVWSGRPCRKKDAAALRRSHDLEGPRVPSCSSRQPF
jgi:hypothetical protein